MKNPTDERSRAISRISAVASLAFAIGLLFICVSCSAPRVQPPLTYSAEHYCAQAGARYLDHDIPSAMAALRRAVTVAPDHAEAHRLMGLLHLGRGELHAAERHLRRAVELQPNLLVAQAELGSVFLAEARWREAASLYRALMRSPDGERLDGVHAGLGRALENLGQLPEAAQQFKLAILSDPARCREYNDLGLVYERLGEGPRARNAFEQAVRRCPGDAEPYFNLGRVLSIAGDVAGASRAFQRCYALAPASRVGLRCAARELTAEF